MEYEIKESNISKFVFNDPRLMSKYELLLDYLLNKKNDNNTKVVIKVLTT